MPTATTTPDTPGAAQVADMLNRFSQGSMPAAAPTVAPRPAAAPAPAPSLTERPSYPRPNGDNYYPRLLGPSTHDVQLLQSARGSTLADNLYVLLWGDPGTGKTACAEAAFPDLVTLSGDGDTTTDDFVGTWVQNPDGTYTWIDGPLLIAMENGLPLLVDEIALIDSKVLAKLYAAMDGRGAITVPSNPARGRIMAQPGFYVIGACNPNAPGARMSEALLSRFSIHVEATTDYDLAKALGVPTKIVTVAKNLVSKRASGEISWAPQMRELLAFKRTEERFGKEIAAANLIGIAPEDDRAIVADVLSRTLAAAMVNLRQGEAVK